MRIEYGAFRGIAGCRAQVTLGDPWVSRDFHWIDERKNVIVRQRDIVGQLTLASTGQIPTLSDEYVY